MQNAIFSTTGHQGVDRREPRPTLSARGAFDREGAAQRTSEASDDACGIADNGREVRVRLQNLFCLTEASVAGLIAGALALSGLLWVGILAVI